MSFSKLFNKIILNQKLNKNLLTCIIVSSTTGLATASLIYCNSQNDDIKNNSLNKLDISLIQNFLNNFKNSFAQQANYFFKMNNLHAKEFEQVFFLFKL